MRSIVSLNNGVAIGIFLLLAAATIVGSLAVRSHFNGQSRESFEHTSGQAMNAITRNLQEGMAELRGIQGLFNASELVTRDEFEVFVSVYFNFGKRTQALEWIPRVTEEAREEFIRKVRQEGFVDFSIHPETDSLDHFPVTYVVPLEPNLPAVGFDLASEPNRRAALERARDTGKLVATAPITLVQETEEQAGFLVFAPIYSTGVVPPTIQERRSTLSGFGLAVFRVGDFIQDAIPSTANSGFNLDVFDAGPDGTKTLIHSDAQAYPELSHGQGITSERTIDVADRSWVFQFSGPQGFGVGRLAGSLWIFVLIAGGTVSSLSLGFSYLLLNGRSRAISMAEYMTRSFVRSEAQRDQLFELSQDLIFTADIDGRFLFVSGASQSILGREPAEMMGQPYLDFVHPEDREAIAAAAATSFQGSHATSLDARFIRTDGEPAWLNWIIQLIPGPSGLIFGVGRDVTAQKKDQDEIQILARFPEENPSPVMRITNDGILEYANSPSDLILRHFQCKVGEKVPDYCMGKINTAINLGTTTEIELDCKDRVYSCVISPVPGAGYINFYARDITDRKELERMKDEFIAMVSHELRTPLTSIKGFVELALEEAKTSDAGEQRNFLEAAERNALRLEHLIDELLEISRLEGGMLVLDQESFDLHEVVDQIIREMQADILEKDIKLTVDDDPIPAMVHADRSRVMQILTNLVGNAVKYIPAQSTIQVSVHPSVDSGLLQIDVIDNGQGIHPDDIERLFERFFRAGSSSTQTASGTGLGLAITKSLIELHGGRIWVDSQVGVGSTFSFTLLQGTKEPPITRSDDSDEVISGSQ